MKTKLIELWTDESGAAATEYSLIAVLVSVATIAALVSLGAALSGIFFETADQTAAAVSDS